MTWIKLDDTIPDHDRMIRAGDRAAWLWICGLCWSSRHLADGKIPYDVVPRLTGQRDAHELALRLVECGLWSRTKTGFTIRKYADFQRTKAQVSADRDGATERKRRSRAAGKSRRDAANVTAQDIDAVTDAYPPQPPVRRGANGTGYEVEKEVPAIPAKPPWLDSAEKPMDFALRSVKEA